MEADLLQTLDSILYNIDTESWENTSFDLYSALGFISNENEYRIYDTFDKFSNEYMHYNYFLNLFLSLQEQHQMIYLQNIEKETLHTTNFDLLPPLFVPLKHHKFLLAKLYLRNI